MKKPTLRLRQVFEGPTHFKVVKPLGNPIKIAKKGLSPNLMGRLRKFARNGEVPDPVDDTIIQESDVAPTEVRVIGLDGNVEEGERPNLIESPSGTRPRPKRPVQTGSAISGPTDTEPTALADVPAPVVRGAVSGRPRPLRPNVTVEPVAAAVEGVAPAQPTAVEAEPVVPAEEEPVPAAKEPAPAEPSLFERALGLVNFDLAKYEAASPEMKPIIRQAAQAAFAAKAVADADVAAAEAETSALAAEQAAQKEELKRLQTSADEARTIQKNILTDFDYLKNPTTYLGSMSTLGQIGTAISLAAGAFASGMTGMPNFAQKIYDNAIEQDLQAQKRRADSLYQRLVNAGNSVENAENMVRAQLKLVGAAEQTRRAAEIKLPQVKAKIQAEAAKQALDATNTMQRIAKDQAEEAREAALAPLRERKLKAEVSLAEGAPEREAEKARMEKKDADLKESRLNLDRWQAKQKLKIDEERLKFDKFKMDQDISSEEAQRTFNVAGQPIQAKDKTQARNAEEAILGESEFIDLAEKTLEIFKQHPVAANVWNTTAYNTAKLFLGQLIEKYPKVERFRRPLNVTASKVVKGAMGSLQGLESAVFNRPEEVLGAMINEAKNARRVGIRTYARPTPDGQKQAEQAIKAVEAPATEDLFE